MTEFVLRNNLDALGIIRGDVLVDCSEPLVRLLGADSKDELVGRTHRDFTTPESARQMSKRLRRRYAGKSPGGPATYVLRRKDGELVTVEAALIPWYGEPMLALVRVVDVTKREKRLEALVESEQLFRTVAESLPVGVIIADSAGRNVYANQEASRVTGYSVEELIRGVWFADPDDARGAELYKAALAQGTASEYETFIVRKDGARVPVSVVWGPIKDSSGAVVGINTVFIDISARKAAEEALRRSEQQYRELIESLPVAVYRAAPDGDYRPDTQYYMEFVGDTVETITGYPASNFRGPTNRPWLSLIHPDDLQRALDTVRAAADRQEAYVLTYRIIRPDGETVWLRDRGRPTPGRPDGEMHAQGIVFDVTEAALARRALFKSEAALRAFVDALPGPAVLVDSKGQVLLVNQAAVAHEGKPPSEVVGRNIRELATDKTSKRRVELIREALRTGEPAVFEDSRAGRHWVNYFLPTDDSDPQARRLAIVAFDITKRKQAEEELTKAHADLERAYSMQSEFLHNVSHEVRTPLTAVQAYAGILLEGMAGSLTDEQQDLIRKVLKSSERLLDIVETILETARLRSGPAILNPRVCEPSQIVERAIAAVQTQAEDKGLKLVFIQRGKWRTGLYDEGKLSLVVTNLLSNAVKFTEQGAVELVLQSRPEGFDLVVADTGPGIPEDGIERIFDDFTQLPNENGSKSPGFGLGLAIVAAVVDALDGTLILSSAEGVGAAFTVRFPRIPQD